MYHTPERRNSFAGPIRIGDKAKIWFIQTPHVRQPMTATTLPGVGRSMETRLSGTRAFAQPDENGQANISRTTSASGVSGNGRFNRSLRRVFGSNPSR